MNVKKVGEFIKQKRKEKKLTQKELAEKLSITDRAISKWERGICCPDISILKELSSILEVSVNELLAGEEIEKLEKEKTDDVLVDSVKQYTAVEKKKNKKLLIITIILLIFYVGLVIAMYLTFNQVNKTDGLNWEIIQNKRLADRFYTALENYDYETLKQMQRESYGYGRIINEDEIEDENKCDEYEQQRKNSELESEPGLICMLKYFEEEGVKFISHKFSEQFYIDGEGKFGVNYNLVATYKNTKIELSNMTVVNNGIITFMSVGWGYTEDPFFSQRYPDICRRIDAFFNSDGYPKWEE